jgi:hypothetical protein
MRPPELPSRGGERYLAEGSIFSAAAIGRTEPETLEGSDLVSQRDSAGTVYVSHLQSGHYSEEPVYLEIQQGRGTGLTLYLVAQRIRPADAEPFGLYAADLSLAGSFLVSLPAAEYAERLADPVRATERLYLPLDPSSLRALGRMVIERRGKIILKGLYGESEFLIDETSAGRMQEVISAYIEISP